ncbi:serine O-acetyltransferase [Basilea psittacipulmonis]|nr:serine O-acetyltransferase [Basilea psittacipulmonis]
MGICKMEKRLIENAQLWSIICQEAKNACANEPILTSFLHQTVLSHDSFERMLAFHLSNKLAGPIIDSCSLYEICLDALNKQKNIVKSALDDIQAYYLRDAACESYSQPLLYHKGYHATQAHRINHFLWEQGRKTLAFFLQNRISEVFAVDIHPAARIGSGIMIDHATGVVIGETVIMGDNISILHGVTLGGSGKERGDRHPKIEDGVLIGANASILGNIRVGRCAKIGAGSVVVNDVAAHTTVVGVPAKTIIRKLADIPASDMDQSI